MNILFSGDFYVSDDFQNKDLIDKSVIDLFDKADYRIVNLEAPLTTDEPKNKILKTGPHLRMSEDTVMPYLKQLKIDAVTLANNHILDYGATGLHDTFESLKRNKIDYVGAGNNLNEATQPLTLEKDGMRIAILNFCENEWSIAEEEKPGANPMDIIDNANQIKSAKTNHDKVICIIHGGHEYYHLPSPRMQKQYRFYVDNGADVIVGHHTHCISGYEVYNNVPIIYSLGNFLFTKQSNHNSWYKGIVIKLAIEKNITFSLFMISQDIKSYIIDIEYNKKNNYTNNFINEINGIIDNPEILTEKWNNYINSKQKVYINYLSPVNGLHNKYLRALFQKIGLKFISLQYLLYLTNIIRCQAHRDLLENTLKKSISK